MNRHALDELKQQIPLLKYLQALDWQQARPIGFGRFLGLCPLHDDHQPSFLVDPHKNLFYCYGCRRGGDVIRFAEIGSPKSSRKPANSNPRHRGQRLAV